MKQICLQKNLIADEKNWLRPVLSKFLDMEILNTDIVVHPKVKMQDSSFVHMKKRISFFILFILFILAAKAQQEPTYINYMFTKPMVNVGFTGAEKTINAYFINSTHLMGMGEGKPVTSGFGIEAPFEMFGTQHGVGIHIISDVLGFQNNVNVNFGYAYHHKLQGGTLGGGFSASIMSYGVVDPDFKPVEQGIDNYIPDAFQAPLNFTVGLGAYYETTEYYLGFSATNLNSPEILYSKANQVDLGINFYVPHFYLVGAYNIALPDPLFDLQPTFLLSTDLAGYALNLNATMLYNKKYWGGLGIKLIPFNLASVTMLAGLELVSGLNLGYGMNVNVGRMMLGGPISHEVLVTYSFNLEGKRDQKYKSIRYL